MKKFLSIILISILLFTMVIPFAVSATGVEDLFTVQGKWKFNETLALSNFSANTKEYVNFTFENDTKNYIGFNYHTAGFLQGLSLTSVSGNMVEMITSFYQASNGWQQNGRVIDFGDTPQAVSSEFYGWLLENATLMSTVCDGSTCPATDMNMDNICDDCGMLFAVPRDYVLPSPYDAWTEPTQKIFPYAFVYYDENDAPTLVVSVNRPYYLDGHVQVDPAEANSYVRYSVWGDTWRLVNSSDGYGTFKTSNVIPSVDIYNYNNEIVFNADGDFFQIPLWEVVGNLAQGEVERMNLTTTMITLTVCSVGLIALLVGLSLLLKVFRTFRA